jgi:selenocysteine lyase/cysteine desulfurase
MIVIAFTSYTHERLATYPYYDRHGRGVRWRHDRRGRLELLRDAGAGDRPGHIVASPIEHPCVVEPLQQLTARGFEVESLSVGADGVIDAGSLKAWVRPE